MGDTVIVAWAAQLLRMRQASCQFAFKQWELHMPLLLLL